MDTLNIGYTIYNSFLSKVLAYYSSDIDRSKYKFINTWRDSIYDKEVSYKRTIKYYELCKEVYHVMPDLWKEYYFECVSCMNIKETEKEYNDYVFF